VYLFAGADGKPLTTIKTAWRNLMRWSQITGFRIHDLRHTFASRLIDEGATLQEIAALLGHTQAVTTFRYAHLSLEAQKRLLARLASPSKLMAMLEAS
jgi:integrase